MTVPRTDGQEGHCGIKREKRSFCRIFFKRTQDPRERGKSRNTEHRSLYFHLSNASKLLLKIVHTVKRWIQNFQSIPLNAVNITRNKDTVSPVNIYKTMTETDKLCNIQGTTMHTPEASANKKDSKLQSKLQQPLLLAHAATRADNLLSLAVIKSMRATKCQTSRTR